MEMDGQIGQDGWTVGYMVCPSLGFIGLRAVNDSWIKSWRELAKHE